MGETVEVGSFDLRAVTAKVGEAHVVSEDKNDIGAATCCGACRWVAARARGGKGSSCECRVAEEFTAIVHVEIVSWTRSADNFSDIGR